MRYSMRLQEKQPEMFNHLEEAINDNDSDIDDDSMLHYMEKVENNNDGEANDDLRMDSSNSEPSSKRSRMN
ncbi:hypothetical protein FQA39_LY07259 [Lamprigera yunnana]|nr:hypothetical protein FQA39_LY07259 [Lamprigera yunnana]